MQSFHSFILELMVYAVSIGVRFVRQISDKLTEVETTIAEEFIANKFRTMTQKPEIKVVKRVLLSSEHFSSNRSPSEPV